MTVDALLRKAEFKEIAREILRKDREHRKAGMAVDTGGSIARALERAYKAGIADAGQSPDARDEGRTLSWIEIPSRSRDVVVDMMRRATSNGRSPRRDVLDLDAVRRVVLFYVAQPELGMPVPRSVAPDHWRIAVLADDDGSPHLPSDRNFAPRTVDALIRMGVLHRFEIDGNPYACLTPAAVDAYIEHRHEEAKAYGDVAFEVRGDGSSGPTP